MFCFFFLSSTSKRPSLTRSVQSFRAAPSNLIYSQFVFQVYIRRPSNQTNWFLCLSEVCLDSPRRRMYMCRMYANAVANQLQCVCDLRWLEASIGNANILIRQILPWLVLWTRLGACEHSKQVYSTKLCLFKTGFKYTCTAYLMIFLLCQAETHIWSASMNLLFVRGSHRT